MNNTRQYPGWPWLAFGALLLALILTVYTHLPARHHARPAPPPVALLGPTAPTTPPPSPAKTGDNAPTTNTHSTATNIFSHKQSPEEALTDTSDAPETAPNPLKQEIPEKLGQARPGPKPFMASNLDLFKAIKRKDLAAVRKIITTFPALLEARNYKGATGMQLAAVEGDAEMVGLFLDRGANVNAKCNLYLYAGQSALHLAAGMGYTGVVQVLLEHGAEVNATNIADETPLHEAAVQGRRAVVRLLLSHGANINAKQKDGYTPLGFAAINGHLDMVKLLVAQGANVNSKANDGTTPAAFADMLGKADIVKFLHRHGGK